MRTSKIYLILFSLLAFLWACEKDGEMIVVKGLKESNLSIDKDNIMLSLSSQNEVVLSFSWDESNLEISDESSKIPSSLVNVIIEVSKDEDFSESTEIVPKSNPHNITGLALNTLALNLGLIPNESAKLYFRTKTSLGNNGEAKVSDAISVNVTPFGIDLSKGKILNKDKEDTGLILYSENSDGVYSGFMSVTAWQNWYLQEADGKLWGNIAVDGNAFVVIDDEENMWNMWFPGAGGVYLTTLNSNTEEWTANHIEKMYLTGGVEEEMTYVKSENCWMLSFETANANTIFKIEGDTKLYNKTTSTDDDNAIAGKITIQPNESTETFEYSLEADATEFTVGQAGEYTIKLFVADPTNLHYTITSGATVIEDPISEFLYVIGVDDGLTGGDWNFDNYLRLTNDLDSTFAGVINVNSNWGFQFTLEEGNWSDIYGLGDEEGKLKFKSDDNIPAPTPGLYLIEADLKKLTYSLTEISKVSYAGFNDEWDLIHMTESSLAGVFYQPINIAKASEWGAKVYINENWDLFFGGENSTLQYGQDGFEDDKDIETGNYDLIVNLPSSSYVLLSDEIYITGLNDVYDFTSVVLTKTESGIYKGTATINAPSPWGIQIHLDDSWDRFFGGSFDELIWGGENIKDDQSLEVGAYNLKVDFINNNCSFTKAE